MKLPAVGYGYPSESYATPAKTRCLFCSISDFCPKPPSDESQI